MSLLLGRRVASRLYPARLLSTLRPITAVPVTTTIHDTLESLAAASVDKEPVFLLDIGDVYRKHVQWARLLPRVEPFYAVKCNNDIAVLQALKSLGTGFDCASLVEMQTMLSLGVAPQRLIYAQPCKPPSHIRYARDQNVEMMTFDNEDEVVKIKSIYPAAKLVLRIRIDDSKATYAVCPTRDPVLNQFDIIMLSAK